MATLSLEIAVIDRWRLDTVHHLKRIDIDLMTWPVSMTLSVDGRLRRQVVTEFRFGVLLITRNGNHEFILSLVSKFRPIRS